MTIRRVFLGSAIAPGHQLPGNGRQQSRRRKQLLQHCCTNVQPRAEHLGFGDMTEVFMGDLVC